MKWQPGVAHFIVDGQIVETKKIEWARPFIGGLRTRWTISFEAHATGTGYAEIWDDLGNLLVTTAPHGVMPGDFYNVKAKA